MEERQFHRNTARHKMSHDSGHMLRSSVINATLMPEDKLNGGIT